MSLPDPSAFDAVATDYDVAFTRSPLGRLLRGRVWQSLTDFFEPGDHILELACGTGEDAVWMARHGMRVTAVDGSAKMLQQALKKTSDAGAQEAIELCHASLQDYMASERGSDRFDGVLANFGGLNTIAEWTPLAQILAGRLRSGAHAILVPMGPFCPWETLWHLAHGNPENAFRRQRQPAAAQIGDSQIPIWYPSPGRLRNDFNPWFHHRQTFSLGLWLPPTYLGHLVERWPRLFHYLNRLEVATAKLTAGWGDHYILVLQRR